MKTNFFTEFQKLKGVNASISITQNNELMSVSIKPTNHCKDDTIEILKPLNITGTATEIDDAFFQVIQKPISKTMGIVTNANQYAEQQEFIKKNNQEAKDLKEKTNNISKELKELIKDQETTIKNQKTIRKKLLELKTINPNHKQIKEVEDALNLYCSQNKLFN